MTAMLTKVMARELAEHGIRLVCAGLTPGAPTLRA